MITFKDFTLGYNGIEYTSDVGGQLAVLNSQRNLISLHGTDLAMLGEGDLIPNNSTSFRDLSLAEGILNYAQAITHRLMCVRGYHPEFTDLGVPWFDYLGTTYNSFTELNSEIIYDIANELLKDDRTLDVLSVNVTRDNDPSILYVSVTVVPIFDDNPLTIGFNVSQ